MQSFVIGWEEEGGSGYDVMRNLESSLCKCTHDWVCDGVCLVVLCLFCVHMCRESDQKCLCVLSPHRLSVFTVTHEAGRTREEVEHEEEEGRVDPSYTLLPLYTHHLRRTAANMTWGNFEGHSSEEGGT